MNKKQFIEQLRTTADVLKPLTEAVSPSCLVWDGTQYAKSNESKMRDPYALAWWFALISIAELIEAQESPLTVKQMTYLHNLLFGGMGSLNDLSFDPKSVGDTAKTVNDRLDNQRRSLYATFKDIKNE